MIDVEELNWEQFQKRFKWSQGEHVSLIGPTGEGKTTLAKEILPRRAYTIVFATKKKDPLIDEFERDGYKRMKEWAPVPAEIEPKIILHPPFQKKEPREAQQVNHFTYALDRAFDEGHWTVYIDELHYFIDELKLARLIKRLWNQGRSLKVSVVSSFQRPSFVPHLAYSAPTHLFFFHNGDELDSKKMGGLGGKDRRQIAAEINTLAKHEVLYFNTRTGELVRTKVTRR